MTKEEKSNYDQTKYIEYPYLEELNLSEITTLIKGPWVVVDPGKNKLLYMKNNKGDKLTFTARQYLAESKRLKYNRLIQNYKDKNGISELEKQLIGYDSKTCDFKLFIEYIKKKNEINEQLEDKYWDGIFRQYKWYGYINKQRCYDKLAKTIKDKFGEDVTIVYGDWSFGKHMRGIAPVPGIGLKRELSKQFKIFNIDEYRTSIINSKTYNKCENIYLPDKKGVLRKMHSILTYQMENNRKGCINRDRNAVDNMITIVESFLRDRSRPEIFRRSTLEDYITIGKIKPVTKETINKTAKGSIKKIPKSQLDKVPKIAKTVKKGTIKKETIKVVRKRNTMNHENKWDTIITSGKLMML